MEKKMQRVQHGVQAVLMEHEAHEKLFPEAREACLPKAGYAALCGRENGVHYTTVMKWCRAGKDKILKERHILEQEIIIAPEDISVLIALKI